MTTYIGSSDRFTTALVTMIGFRFREPISDRLVTSFVTDK